MLIFKNIKKLITRNVLVPHGVYITYDNIKFNISEKRLMNTYKLVESNFRNREEEKEYAEALTQVCPYCAFVNNLAYKSLDIPFSQISTYLDHFFPVYVESFWYYYDEYRVKCPNCECEYRIAYNINSSKHKYFGEL